MPSRVTNYNLPLQKEKLKTLTGSNVGFALKMVRYHQKSSFQAKVATFHKTKVIKKDVFYYVFCIPHFFEKYIIPSDFKYK